MTNVSSDTICGHDRETLKRLIERLDGAKEPPARFGRKSDYAAEDALLDPAIVAKMMAAEGRRLGFVVECLDGIDVPGGMMTYGLGIIWREQAIEIDGMSFDMPKTRAILRAWLDMADGDSEGALRALQGKP